jgi:hypothetical protein
MIKIVCIAALVGFIVSCKTSKNYVVSKESYEVINVLGKNLGKRKEDQLYYKTYDGRPYFIDRKYNDWGGFITFYQLSQNRLYRKNMAPKSINFQEYLTEADLQHMREQVKKRDSVKWIKNRLAPNIKLYKDVKKVSLHAQLLMKLNRYSEPVFSIDKKIALVYVVTSGGEYMHAYIKKEEGWELLTVIQIFIE